MGIVIVLLLLAAVLVTLAAMLVGSLIFGGILLATPRARVLVPIFFVLVPATITGSLLGGTVIVAGALLYTNLRDAREDARQGATRVATTDAKARVAEAFE